MINYNTREWWKVIFNFHKADTLRVLTPLLIFMSLYAWAICYLEMRYLRLSEHLKNMTIMHTLLGFAISMLLVFRTNTAYDRWWEGRKLWGALVNNSRNLAIKMNAFLQHDDHRNRSFFKKLIPRFAFELKSHLQNEKTRLALDEQPHPEIPDFDTSKHVPNQIALLMMQRVNQLYKQNTITGYQLIVMNAELQSFMDVCGACERIKNTPIPYSYSSFIKKFIFIYVITLPLGLCFSLGYMAIPVTVFIFYVMASLERVAEEIEDPFGTDSNDLPMDRISSNIQRNVEDILA
jgi:putative membrane protein